MDRPGQTAPGRASSGVRKVRHALSSPFAMRAIGLKTLSILASLALILSLPATALAAASGSAAPGGAAAAGVSGGNGVSGQSPQLSKLTGEQTPEEQAEELAEKNAAAAKASESKPISAGLLALIGSVAALLIGGIAYLILRDARSVAPAAGIPTSGSNRDQAARMRKRRMKAKAARQSRKRNR
jgi:hypothetical protein